MTSAFRSIVTATTLSIYLSLTSAQIILPPTPAPTTCPILLPTPYDPPVKPRVVDGQLSPPIPYVVSLFSSGTFTCTGSVISPTTVLTAAHCIRPDNKTAHEYFVKVGASNIQQGAKVRVKSFKRHPNFNVSIYDKHDVAVLFLLNPIPNAQPIKLATNPAVPAKWSFARIYGFGRSLPGGGEGFLRRGDIPISPCSWVGTETLFDFRPDGVGCTGGETVSNCSSCSGDSGGPWVQYDVDGSPVQVGIHFAGTLCGSRDTVSFFVRTGAVSSWLRSIGSGFTRAKRPLKSVFVKVTPSAPPSPSATPLPAVSTNTPVPSVAPGRP